MRPTPHAVAWLFAIGCVGAVHQAPAASLARRLDTIFASTRVERATLSRDGQHLAFAIRDERELQLIVYGLDQPDRAARLSLDAPPGAQVRHLEWIAPDRLVAVADTAVVLVVDTGARVVIQLDDAKDFTPSGEKRSGRPAVRVLGAADEPDTALLEVQWFASGSDVKLDLISVNVRTLERRLAFSREVESPGGAWMLDRQGRPRVLQSHAGMTRRFFHLPVGGGRSDWQSFDRLVSDATAAAWQVTPRNVAGERAFPLGFDGDPHVLYFASNIGRDTYGIYALDVRTGAPTGFAVEDLTTDLVDFTAPPTHSGLIFDRARQTLAGISIPTCTADTRWLDAEPAEVQALFAEKFPGREVRLLEWDDARERFLVLVTASIDAGRYFVLHRSDGRCVEYQRNVALPPDDANRVESVVFATADGRQLTGTVTWPRPAAGTKPALVVWLHDGPLEQVRPGFQREAQALAVAGFAVAQINYRGSSGFGRRNRELIREAFDRVPLEDALAAVAMLEGRGCIDRARVTVAGEGFGGYLALRALQTHPDVFCGAVAINAPLDLAQLYGYERDMDEYRRSTEQSFLANGRSVSRTIAELEPNGNPLGDADAQATTPRTLVSPPVPIGGGGPPSPVSFEREFARWFFGPASRQNNRVTAELERLAGPVLLLHDPRLDAPAAHPVRKLRDALLRRKQAVEFVELPSSFAQGAAEVCAPIFREIGEFLTACRAETQPPVRTDAAHP